MNLTLNSNSEMNRRFILLAPPDVPLSKAFHLVEGDLGHRQELLADMQRLRGRVYLADHAITPQDLTGDGRHVQAIDEESWHLLIVNAGGRVIGCTRYLQHPPWTRFRRLRVRTAALARSSEWSSPLRHAVEKELEVARQNGFSYVEVGGWALDESLRGSADALRSVLFTYAWSQLIGGCLGLVTATERNGSASILRRIGGHPLEWDGTELPPYYDPQYGCDMEVLRFDSRLPSPRYQRVIDEIRSQIPTVPVICATHQSNTWHAIVDRLHNLGNKTGQWSPERAAPAA
jgi:hypothetical protein